MIDPNAAPVRSLSREERELMIAANNGYLLAFDNLSGLPVWLSDALCRLASGGSFALELSSAVKAAPEAGSSGCKLLAHMLAAVKPVDVIDEMLIVDVASLEL